MKSLSRLPTLKSIVFTSVPVLGSRPADLSLLLGNVARCSLLEELVLYKCGMVSIPVQVTAGHRRSSTLLATPHVLTAVGERLQRPYQ